MSKSLSILGSTGSIGTQALEVVRNCGYKIRGLAAGKNIELLKAQIKEFRPEAVSVASTELAEQLRSSLPKNLVKVYNGKEGLKEIAALSDTNIVLNAVVGIEGLEPTISALRSGHDIALANKETLVAGGEMVMKLAGDMNASIIPVDSEHSAIFQCLNGNRIADVERLILTASGGPFRGLSYDEMRDKTPEQALKHPNWSMGRKISIDSATMMNKGLEIIEASRLFGLGPDRIKTVLHPQSIVHSLVEYIDGSVIAQLGCPDMRIPIQYALTFPERAAGNYKRLDLTMTGKLDFMEVDLQAFPCIRLAYEALQAGGTMPAVLNGANERAVELYLDKKIKFTDIPETVEKVMKKHIVNTAPVLDDIIEVDLWSREETDRILGMDRS
ncbi:MAG: 1-deoxy-D-xylulose-5-phosphate reductoisomerase [Eubacteriales bacterium]|nr:1-deoxy-D-xylulose-5-phosphate reductoisomerase [Eubacteriales bacterium]